MAQSVLWREEFNLCSGGIIDQMLSWTAIADRECKDKNSISNEWSRVGAQLINKSSRIIIGHQEPRHNISKRIGEWPQRASDPSCPSIWGGSRVQGSLGRPRGRLS